MRRTIGRLISPLTMLMLLLLTALLALPRNAAAQPTYYTVNPDGGQTEDDGLRITVGNGRYQVERNGNYQVYAEGAESGTMQWILVLEWNAQTVLTTTVPAGRMCVSRPNDTSEWECLVPENSDMSDSVVQYWDDVGGGILVNGDTTIVEMEISEEWLEGDLRCEFSLGTGLSYTVPNYYADVAAMLTFNPATADNCPNFSKIQLYLVADMLLDGSDEGPSRLTEYEGARVIAQFNETGVGGFREVGTTWDSYAAASFPCLYGATESEMLDGQYPCLDDSFNSGTRRGVHFGEPLPGRVDDDEMTDAGVGVHFNLKALPPSTVVETQIFFAPASLFPDDVAAAPPAECTLTPDMAVSPQFINLAPGGTATVEVAMRNLCNDAPFIDSDLLVSFSDGLSVTDGSQGMLNLGQRAAWQKLSLAPGETRTWTVTVRAADTLVAAPVHITELYHRGGVASRIDGVFITPAPAAPAPAPVVEAPAPAPADPAPLPSALPNTAGESLPLLVVAGLALSVLLFGRRLVRR